MVVVEEEENAEGWGSERERGSEHDEGEIQKGKKDYYAGLNYSPRQVSCYVIHIS